MARLPVLPHQKQAIKQSLQKVDALRPGFAADLVTATECEPWVAMRAGESTEGMAALIAAGERVGTERAEAARREAEFAALAPIRERLLKESMEDWWRWTYPHNRQWERSTYMQDQAKPVEAAMKQQIEAMPAAELRRIEAEWTQEERLRKPTPTPTPTPTPKPAPRRPGPSPF
jgi:hypothetical protein